MFFLFVSLFDCLQLHNHAGSPRLRGLVVDIIMLQRTLVIVAVVAVVVVVVVVAVKK